MGKPSPLVRSRLQIWLLRHYVVHVRFASVSCGVEILQMPSSKCVQLNFSARSELGQAWYSRCLQPTSYCRYRMHMLDTASGIPDPVEIATSPLKHFATKPSYGRVYGLSSVGSGKYVAQVMTGSRGKAAGWFPLISLAH